MSCPLPRSAKKEKNTNVIRKATEICWFNLSKFNIWNFHFFLTIQVDKIQIYYFLN